MTRPRRATAIPKAQAREIVRETGRRRAPDTWWATTQGEE